MTKFNTLIEPCLLESAQTPEAVAGGAATNPAASQGTASKFITGASKFLHGAAKLAGGMHDAWKRGRYNVSGGMSRDQAETILSKFRESATEIERGIESLDELNKVVSRFDQDGHVMEAMDKVDEALKGYSTTFRDVVKFATEAGSRGNGRRRLLDRSERDAQHGDDEGDFNI
jgi:hypothetical protein